MWAMTLPLPTKTLPIPFKPLLDKKGTLVYHLLGTLGTLGNFAKSRRRCDMAELRLRDIVEKGTLMGLGALALTRERAQSIVEELVKRGEARRDEVKELVEKLASRGEKEREELRCLIREEVEKALSGMGLATKADIEALSEKIEALARKRTKTS
ncbi:MAG TPA: hypothetical protein ENG33_03230 [Chloroflexi bacterium]|nr:hypothetical protein [Chloroflexota bacterium]